MAETFDYSHLDKIKRFAQNAALETFGNLPPGVHVILETIGESAFAIDMGVAVPLFPAGVQEGLGTKNLVADFESLFGRGTYYDHIGQCAVATIVNDLITIGARPFTVSPHWAAGSKEYLSQSVQKFEDLVRGWVKGCTEAQAAYVGGETALLEDIILPNAIEISGSASGFIQPKERLTCGQKLRAGDHIVLIESSGVHANGLTFIRRAHEAQKLCYRDQLPSGRSFGDALLTPTHIYAKLQQALFDAGTDIHYMVNITGHGWAKLMRAQYDFSYRMHTLMEPQEEFTWIQRCTEITDKDMYRMFNMGAGFAFMVPSTDAKNVVDVANIFGYKALDAGIVENGSKQVIIEPKGRITYTVDDLNIR